MEWNKIKCPNCGETGGVQLSKLCKARFICLICGKSGAKYGLK